MKRIIATHTSVDELLKSIIPTSYSTLNVPTEHLSKRADEVDIATLELDEKIRKNAVDTVSMFVESFVLPIACLEVDECLYFIGYSPVDSKFIFVDLNNYKDSLRSLVTALKEALADKPFVVPPANGIN